VIISCKLKKKKKRKVEISGGIRVELDEN